MVAGGWLDPVRDAPATRSSGVKRMKTMPLLLSIPKQDMLTLKVLTYKVVNTARGVAVWNCVLQVEAGSGKCRKMSMNRKNALILILQTQ